MSEREECRWKRDQSGGFDLCIVHPGLPAQYTARANICDFGLAALRRRVEEQARTIGQVRKILISPHKFLESNFDRLFRITAEMSDVLSPTPPKEGGT